LRIFDGSILLKVGAQQHIELGYRIEDEQPTPVNGLCSFIAVRELPDSDPIGELVTQALKGQQLLGE
jgi:hypothetical protein